MSYEVQILEAAPQTLAAVRDRANQKNIASRIGGLLGEVWGFLKNSEVKNLGINVMVYHADENNGCLFLTDEGLPVEAGVLVESPFESTDRIICSATPGGRAATVAHIGPYDKLGDAHGAVQNWCKQNGHAMAGPNWEVYGHWTDNVEELRTDVFYLLK